MKQEPVRCQWAEKKIFHTYHDQEWGQPLHDDQALFEILVLEGMQAGLSWATILKKRAAFRKAFDAFSIEKVARYDEQKEALLLKDKNLIRHKGKIKAAINNAKIVQYLQKKRGSFANYIWSFSEGKVVHNPWKSEKEIPSQSRLSEKIARDLQQLGGKFVGPTIMYAFLQAVGVINDHEAKCFTRQLRAEGPTPLSTSQLAPNKKVQ